MKKTPANIKLKGERLRVSSPPRLGTDKNAHFTVFQHCIEVLARATEQEKEIKGIQIGKVEVKLSLFADDIILFVENPKDSIKTLLELIHLIKLQDTKSTYKNQLWGLPWWCSG